MILKVHVGDFSSLVVVHVAQTREKRLQFTTRCKMMAIAAPRSLAASAKHSKPAAYISRFEARPCVRAAVLTRSFIADRKRVQLSADPKQPQDQQPDAYCVATARLQQLLTDAALSNKDVVPIDFIDACSVEERLTLFANMSSLTIMSAFAVCLIFGELDPLGGMWLDAYTLDAMGQGVLFALPLLACSAASRTSFCRPFPVLREMHELQHDLLKHFTADMTLVQRGIWLVFVLLPGLLLLLPTSKAVLVWAGAFIQQALLQTWSDKLSLGHISLGPLGQVLPPVLSGCVAGAAAACCFSVRPQQLAVVRDALRSADAYFRLTQAQAVGAAAPAEGSQKAQRSTRPLPPSAAGAAPTMFATSTLADGLDGSYDEEGEEQQELAGTSSSQAAADAFRMVSMVWFLSHRRVARLAYLLTSLNVAYLGVVWHATGNLGAPAAAAFLHAAAEMWLGEWQARRQSVTNPVKANRNRQ
ncbi:hypothetical protein COO60DRAFT_7107 [Scenedesmus sp. NREL 46B-D3]|nr:hypothetical protein COO60DRAFT_7107 [Scenedesmus sp. NREL 46B-D3]